MEEWFTLAEVSKILKLKGENPQEDILKLIFQGDAESLTASYIFRYPYKGEYRQDTTEYFEEDSKTGEKIRCFYEEDEKGKMIPVDGKHRKSEMIEVDLQGRLVDLLICGDCRRSDGKVTLSRNGYVHKNPNDNFCGFLDTISIHAPDIDGYPRILLIVSEIYGIPMDELSIDETDLVVTRDSLKRYAEVNGRADVLKYIKLSVVDRTPDNRETSGPFDLKANVAQRRAAKQSDEQICYDLMVEHGQSKKYSKFNTDRLSALAIGIEVFPGQTYSSPKEKDALESKVWKKIASHHKKVTK